MKSLSAWEISSKGLIFAKMFDFAEYDLDSQKKAMSNILYTQDFDLMPLVKESAITRDIPGVGEITETGDITGVAILKGDSNDVDIVEVTNCPCVSSTTHFVPTMIVLLENIHKFVFVGENSENAEAIITSSMVISKEIRDRLVLLSADAASQGRINEDAGYGIRIFEQLIEVVNMNQNPESLIDSLRTLDPNISTVDSADLQMTYVPKGEITAQHIMKFPIAGITKKMLKEDLLAAKMLGEANDFTNILLYEHGRKIPDKVTLLNHKTTDRKMCRTITHNMKLKSIIKSMANGLQTCIVRPNPELTVRGEKMEWPAIIYAGNELQSDASLKELGKYCVEVEVAHKKINNIPLDDKKTTLGNFKYTREQKDNKKRGKHKPKSSTTNSLFEGYDSLLYARNALFHKVLGGIGTLSLTQMQNIVRVHDSYKPEIERLKK